MGVIRGLSTGPLIAGNWAIGTFTILALGSWHICQKRFEDERKQITRVMENMPKRTVKDNSDQPVDPSTTSAL
ncbi:hypothetical protein BDZ97DRAFT_1815827 [Flammula alnicola]|nr:hypothetical protein BDZ97DRAFT_1815827 [Flammula alnicola]